MERRPSWDSKHDRSRAFGVWISRSRNRVCRTDDPWKGAATAQLATPEKMARAFYYLAPTPEDYSPEQHRASMPHCFALVVRGVGLVSMAPLVAGAMGIP